MKRALILFWSGLTTLIVGIANWFTVILGMQDDSKYGKFLRRIVGSCFTFLVLLFTVGVLITICMSVYDALPTEVKYGDRYFNSQYISRNVTFYSRNYETDGYIKTAGGKKTIRKVEWIAKPLGWDSLVCYSDGKMRGYFNMFTGEPVIKPKYRHAWVFSDGLASVDDNGWIKFIDATGKVVIDPKINYMPGAQGYVFHNNHCVVNDKRRDRYGMIDKEGNWVLKPEYFSIEIDRDFWIVDNGEEKCVLDNELNTIIPFLKGNIRIRDEYISVTLSNHIIQRYNHSGEIINDFYINDVSYMTYDSDELRYSSSKTYNENGELVGEKENIDPFPVEKMSKCWCYEAEEGWYGLMTTDGKAITPPSYRNIRAIGYDMYLCKDNCGEGVILNGKGEKIH